jgi:hypothetical protein
VNAARHARLLERARAFHARAGLDLAQAQVLAALAHRRAGHDLSAPRVQQLIELGMAPVMGGAVGSTPAATFATVPADSFFVIAPDVFDEATIPNCWKSKQQALPAWSQQDGFDLPGRGLLAEIEVVFTGTLTCTAGTGTITATDYWPFGLLDNLRFTVNGSPLENAQGLSYELRRQAVRRQAKNAQTSAPTSAGANTVEIHWIVPIADNLVNLWGSILAQSDDLYLRLEYTVAAKSKLFALTGDADVTLTGNLELTYYAWDVPIVPVANMGEKGVLPDTDVLHRFSEFSVPVVSNGDTELKLQQTAGEIERIFLFLDNVGSLLAVTSWSEVRFQFAETEEPYRIGASQLLGKNANDYNDVLESAKAACLDNSYWNQRRDALWPKGVANPKVIVTLPSTVTPNTGARLYGVQESLVGGA